MHGWRSRGNILQLIATSQMPILKMFLCNKCATSELWNRQKIKIAIRYYGVIEGSTLVMTAEGELSLGPTYEVRFVP
jgi:hypothetical protein